MVKPKRNNTKENIIRVATRLFLEDGYTATTIPSIARKVGISTGNLTFHFPTKEHLLLVLVEELCEFQRREIKRIVNEGSSSLMAYCLELTSMTAICDESPRARDFYLAAYTHPLTLAMIQANDTHKFQQIFSDYCPDWEDARFREMEVIVSGIEYATLATSRETASPAARLRTALDTVMTLFHVPAEVRERKIRQVLAMDYPLVGRQILSEFQNYIETVNPQTLLSIKKQEERRGAAANETSR